MVQKSVTHTVFDGRVRGELQGSTTVRTPPASRLGDAEGHVEPGTQATACFLLGLPQSGICVHKEGGCSVCVCVLCIDFITFSLRCFCSCRRVDRGAKSGVWFRCMLFFDSASIIPPSPVNPLMAKPPPPAHSSFCRRSILFNPFTLSIFPWPFASQSPSSISHLSHPSTPPPSVLLLLPLLLVLYPCQTDKKNKKIKRTNLR